MFVVGFVECGVVLYWYVVVDDVNLFVVYVMIDCCGFGVKFVLFVLCGICGEVVCVYVFGIGFMWFVWLLYLCYLLYIVLK